MTESNRQLGLAADSTAATQQPGQSESFPIDALPGPLQQFAVEAAASLPAPSELVAIPALVVAAAAIGNSRKIRLKDNWMEPASLYAAVVSESGTMKSPALQMAAKPLQDRDSSTRRTWSADVTVEKLARLLSENPRGLLLMRDELSAWVRSMNQYKQKGSDREFYLSVWSGAPVKIDRVGDGTTQNGITVPHPCLSVVGCIPPDVVPQLEDEQGLQDGFLPRLLFSWPDPVPTRWSEQVIPQRVRDAYSGLIEQLLGLSYEGEATSLSLTVEAQRKFIDWHDAHCREMDSVAPTVRTVYAKLRGYCARLVLVHSLAMNPAANEVGVASVEAAIKLVNYFKAQAGKVLPLLKESKTSDVERCKAEIRRKLSGCRSLNKRDLQRNSAFNAEVFNQAYVELTTPELSVGNLGVLSLRLPTNRQIEAQPVMRGFEPLRAVNSPVSGEPPQVEQNGTGSVEPTTGSAPSL